MSTGILQLWLELKYPKQYGPEAQERMAEIAEDIVQRNTGLSLSDTEGLRELEATAQRHYVAGLEQDHDTAILDALGTTAAEVMENKLKASSHSRSAKGLSEHQKRIREIAVDAFLRAENEGDDYKQARQRARKKIESETGHSPDTKTVKRWKLIYSPRP